MDKIVFRQDELDAAAAAGARVILLCDSSFTIPLCGGICYHAIGDVSAFIDASPSEAKKLGLCFNGFEPRYSTEDIPSYANVPHAMMSATDPAAAGSFSGSFASSFSGSFTTSFASSYSGSFTTSFTSSLASSFMTSYAGFSAESFSASFAWGYGSGGSFSDSFTVSYRTSFGSAIGFCVPVMGYGIDLI